MRARIDSINKFLDPASAKRKKSPSVIINMMMIVEALQATLNDYNESAAGFVFEGFMAALTGGKQIAGKVGGTLPIEDFVAFSSFGADLPVSLKLLSGTTPVKGSFTNIVDFLLVRGAPAIKYLVAYKAVSGKGKVEKLNLFAFDITRENFIDFISNISGGDTLLSPHGSKKLKIAMAEFNTSNDLASVAQLVVQLAGYNKSGLLHNYVKTGALPSDPTPEEEEEAEKKRAARSAKSYGRTARYAPKELNESIDRGELTLNEAFHHIEKQTLLTEAGEKQWEASFPQLERLSSVTSMEHYGEIDLSQTNIDQLSEIYTEKLRGGVINLLEKAKDLTEHVGAYYSEKRRSTAQLAANNAKNDATEIKGILEEDPRYKK